MRGAAVVAAVAGLGACTWELHRMNDQPRCERDEATTLLPGGTCNQLPPAGTVRWSAGAAAAEAPTPTRAAVIRGGDRFTIFCAPCHGLLGDGRSGVAENMSLRPPPSLHEPRIAALDDARLHQVVVGGYGLMPGYGPTLSEADRWAVVWYVRALQRSWEVALDELPPELAQEAQPWLR